MQFLCPLTCPLTGVRSQPFPGVCRQWSEQGCPSSPASHVPPWRGTARVCLSLELVVRQCAQEGLCLLVQRPSLQLAHVLLHRPWESPGALCRQAARRVACCRNFFGIRVPAGEGRSPVDVACPDMVSLIPSMPNSSASLSWPALSCRVLPTLPPWKNSVCRLSGSVRAIFCSLIVPTCSAISSDRQI